MHNYAWTVGTFYILMAWAVFVSVMVFTDYWTPASVAKALVCGAGWFVYLPYKMWLQK